MVRTVYLETSIINYLARPSRDLADAVHIAAAACHGIDFILTWISTQIANAEGL